jgi:hypothetical protein
MFVAARVWNDRKHLRVWTIVAALLLVSAVVDFLFYQKLLSSRTCSYDSKIIPTGTVYTPHTLEYLQKHPGSSCENLLEDFAGKANEIWTTDSIEQSRMVLAAIYVSCLPLFTVCLVAVLQAVSLTQKSP